MSEIAKDARERVRRATLLADRYAANGNEDLASAVRVYIVHMQQVARAAKDAEDAWTEYLRCFKAPKPEAAP